ncbi:hypothetical protein VTJ49DRAFT_5653 [Mycothermus thermophilus]|uniref:Uncharacterized protein n=1 Tax=Humicola insolens TaxID=85995 RepID=A0ABR3VLK6_HUMIN
MQFTALATLFSLAAFVAAAPAPEPRCDPGRYFCWSDNEIIICKDGKNIEVVAKCPNKCQWIGEYPYCV